MKLTESLLRRLIQEEINEMTGGTGGRGKIEMGNAGAGAGYQRDDDRHEEGEALLRKFQEEKPGAKPTEGELRRLADEMDLHDDAVSDAMGLAGYGKVHSDS
jgi:hypothetical protein